MKPPRSVWVLLSEDGRPLNAALRKYEFTNLELPGSWDVVRYVLPPKPKRKARKGVQPCGCDINTDGAHQHGCRSGSRRPSKARKGGEGAR